MTADSKLWLFKVASGVLIFCAWLVLATFVTTTSCIALFHLVLKNEQVKSAVAHSDISRVMVAIGIGVVWAILQLFLAFLLPIRILKIWQRR
jgi:hypothetical protein